MIENASLASGATPSLAEDLYARRPDIHVAAKIISTAKFRGEVHQFVNCKRYVYSKNATVSLPTVEVFAHTKQKKIFFMGFVVAPDPFEQTRAVVEGVGEYVDVCFGKPDETVVKPDDRVRAK